MTTTMTTAVDLPKALEAPVRPIRPVSPPADLEGTVAPIACREAVARGAAPDVILGGTAGPPMIGALRTKLAGTGSRAAAALASEDAPSAPAAAPEATAAPDVDSTVSVLLAAAITRALGSFRSATTAPSRPAAARSAPSAGTAAPAPPVAVPATATPAGRGLTAPALTPLEQAVHDLVERFSSDRRPREPA